MYTVFYVEALSISATPGQCMGEQFMCVFTCLSTSDLALSLEVPVSHTQMAVLVPPVITSFGFGHIAQRIWPHSDRHSYTTNAWKKIEDWYRRLVLPVGAEAMKSQWRTGSLWLFQTIPVYISTTNTLPYQCFKKSFKSPEKTNVVSTAINSHNKETITKNTWAC